MPTKKTVYLTGDKKEVEKARAHFKARYPGIKVVVLPKPKERKRI